jgi:predicted Zn-dependent protease
LRVDGAAHHSAAETPDNQRRFEFLQAKLIGFLSPLGQTLGRYPLTDTSQPARYARAVGYYRVSDLDNARAELDILIQENPDNPYFQELMGQILFENNHAEESIPYHQRSVDLAPGQPLLLINLARAKVAAHGREGANEAILLLQEATAREPDNAFAWRELASARELRGERGLAELASAEQNYAVGNYPAALNFAERARRTLETGTVSYQRALDISNFAGAELRELRAENRGGR